MMPPGRRALKGDGKSIGTEVPLFGNSSLVSLLKVPRPILDSSNHGSRMDVVELMVVIPFRLDVVDQEATVRWDSISSALFLFFLSQV